MSKESKMRIIETANLKLIACELEHLEAIMRDPKELEQMLGFKVPDNWPEFPESIPHVYALLKSDPASPEWGYHLFVHTKDQALIGEGGFKGKPDAEGVVEIGYAIIPEYRRRGLAFEAARGLAHHAFSHPEVRIVQAHTLPNGTASINVLKKLGMKFMGTVDDPEDGEVLQWSVERKDFSIADFGMRNAD
jgi:RimJ/RimL family protein N-acetyltransferase